MMTVADWTDKELSAAIALAYIPRLLGQVNSEREAYIALQSARTRIAELEAENARCEEWGKSEARMKEQAEATIERLKCCVVCSHVDIDQDGCCSCLEMPERNDKGYLANDVAMHDLCHFTPSRWAERGAP